MLAPQLLVVLLLFSTLPRILPSTAVEIDLAVPKIEMPVDVYVERLGVCPKEEEIIINQLPAAFENHRQAVIRFISEMGPEYDKLLTIQFRITENKENADVIFVIDDLEPPAAGYATSYTLPGGRSQSKVGIDCDVAESVTFSRQVILHEFYHTLGIGHTIECPYLEFMCGAGSEIFFPSSLSLMAIYEKYFNYPVRNEVINYTLPKEVPYVLVLPYNITVNELSSQLAQARSENWQLTKEVINLRMSLFNDIKRLDSDVSGLKSEVSGLNQSLNREINNLNQSLRGEINNLDRELREDMDMLNLSLGKRIELMNEIIEVLKNELMKANNDLSIANRNLLIAQAEINSLRNTIAALQWQLFMSQIILVFAILAIAFILYRVGRKHAS